LDEKSVADLIQAAAHGDCKAAERLGLFYHTVRAHGDDEDKYSDVARKWYELANRCMADPRLKEFLILMIMHGGYTKVAADEVKYLFNEIEVMDPERARRLQDRITEFTRQQNMQEQQR
jgi:hemerythrin superfamily protein